MGEGHEPLSLGGVAGDPQVLACAVECFWGDGQGAGLVEDLTGRFRAVFQGFVEEVAGEFELGFFEGVEIGVWLEGA